MEIYSTGCFTGNLIIFLLISQSIKHLNCFFISYKITVSIAFWYQVSKNSNTQSVIFSIQKLWWYSTVIMYENRFNVDCQLKIYYHFANIMTPKKLSNIVQYSNYNRGYHLLIEMNPNRTLQCRIFIALVKYARLNSELFKKQYSTKLHDFVRNK